MAAPGGKYYIQDQLSTPHPHHANFKALWETKWKTPCDMGVYPFMFGATKDFEPVVKELIDKDMKEPYDWDAYATTFFPHAERLVASAHAAHESEHNDDKASELYLRASALYRIARFPAPRSPQQKVAWEKCKDAARKGLELQKPPTREVHFPTPNGPQPAFFHLPSTASHASPAPLVIIITGLDGYRTELAVWARGFSTLGVALLVVEIPGTGDNPTPPGVPSATDAAWSSMFEWVHGNAALDKMRRVVWGFSTGGFYAQRLAHTHADKVRGVVSQGGGCHHMFDAEWLQASLHGEYPFDLGTTLAYAFGYGTDFEHFKQEARHKFSLLEDGTLERPSARQLIVNGTDDSIFPIDDLYVALQHGSPKESRIIRHRPHMGEPEAFMIILRWIAARLGVVEHLDVFKMLGMLKSQPKY